MVIKASEVYAINMLFYQCKSDLFHESQCTLDVLLCKSDLYNHTAGIFSPRWSVCVEKGHSLCQQSDVCVDFLLQQTISAARGKHHTFGWLDPSIANISLVSSSIPKFWIMRLMNYIRIWQAADTESYQNAIFKKSLWLAKLKVSVLYGNYFCIWQFVFKLIKIIF